MRQRSEIACGAGNIVGEISEKRSLTQLHRTHRRLTLWSFVLPILSYTRRSGGLGFESELCIYQLGDWWNYAASLIPNPYRHVTLTADTEKKSHERLVCSDLKGLFKPSGLKQKSKTAAAWSFAILVSVTNWSFQSDGKPLHVENKSASFISVQKLSQKEKKKMTDKLEAWEESLMAGLGTEIVVNLDVCCDIKARKFRIYLAGATMNRAPT